MEESKEGGTLTLYSNTDQENWAPIFRDFRDFRGFRDDDTVALPRGIGITAKAPHPATAKLFVDFVPSREGRRAVAEGRAHRRTAPGGRRAGCCGHGAYGSFPCEAGRERPSTPCRAHLGQLHGRGRMSVPADTYGPSR